MKALSIIGLLFAAAILATVPVSPQVTPRGVELSVDTAQAYTYGRARRITRRVDRRDYRYADGLTGAVTNGAAPFLFTRWAVAQRPLPREDSEGSRPRLTHVRTAFAGIVQGK